MRWKPGDCRSWLVRQSRWGFLSWGHCKRGIPASNFLSQLRLCSCPAAPSPTGAGGPAPLYANRGEIHLCFLLREFFSSWAQPRQIFSPG